MNFVVLWFLQSYQSPGKGGLEGRGTICLLGPTVAQAGGRPCCPPSTAVYARQLTEASTQTSRNGGRLDDV